jgi:mycothiol synthase
MAVVDLRELPASARAALLALLERADATHDHPALPEPQLLAVTHGTEAPHGERLVLARRGPELLGCALLSPTHDGSTAVHVVVDPAAATRTSVGEALLRRAVQEAPPGAPVHLWVMQAAAGDDARALAEGFVPERDLLQMRAALPLPDEVVEATRPLHTRPFAPGRDDEAWVDTNNRAFAGHPEQGAWSVARLHERMAADWVELDGFLVADDPDGPGLIGACWTKIHRDRQPVLGEIYVIDVDPRHHGQGWGRSLTVAGLVYLAGRGITVGMLYTDATNEAAVALYRSLGFTVDHVDRSYRRDPGAGSSRSGRWGPSRLGSAPLS